MCYLICILLIFVSAICSQFDECTTEDNAIQLFQESNVFRPISYHSCILEYCFKVTGRQFNDRGGNWRL